MKVLVLLRNFLNFFENFRKLAMYDAIHKIYKFDNFVVDTVRRKLLRNGESLQLPAKAFDLLVVLVENNGRLLEREELFQLLWPGQFVEESNLSVNVSALRKALNDREGKTQFIVTIPRQGYLFTAYVNTEDIAHNEQRSAPGPRIDERSLLPWRLEYTKGPAETRSPDINGVPIDSAPTGSAPSDHPGAKVRSGLMIGGLLCALLVAIGIGYWQYSRLFDTLPSRPAKQMGIKRLTLHGKVVRAALSSNGKYFAYVREDKGERSLWLGQTSDGSSMQLRAPSEIIYGSLVFAPDDNSIYCVGTSKERPESVLYRMSVLGAKTETVVEQIHSPPTFSPDGRHVAFVRHSPEQGESALMMANVADGKEESVLAVREWSARFTSDGASWSPDGGLIAVAALNSDSDSPEREVLGVQIADRAIIRITKQKWSSIHRLAWLRDGSALVMVATDKPAFEWLQLWQLSYPRGEAQRITRDLTTYNQSSLSISSDDSSLLAVQLQQINNIWLAPSENLEGARQITFGPPGRLDGAYGLDWTPDGSILYTASTGEGISIWSMKRDGGEVNQITPSGYIERRMSAPADGSYMVFESDRGGGMEIWRSNLDGSQPQQMTTGGKNRSPHIAPDGQWMIYTSARAGRSTIWRMPIDGGTSQQLTETESDWPRVSPDGRQFACFYKPQGENRSWQLAVIDITGGPPLKLFELPITTNLRNGLRWTPDGSAITYRDWKEGIWRQSLHGGGAKRIPDLPNEKLYPYAWSPNGDQFAFTRGTESYDVVLISNFREQE